MEPESRSDRLYPSLPCLRVPPNGNQTRRAQRRRSSRRVCTERAQRQGNEPRHLQFCPIFMASTSVRKRERPINEVFAAFFPQACRRAAAPLLHPQETLCGTDVKCDLWPQSPEARVTFQLNWTFHTEKYWSGVRTVFFFFICTVNTWFLCVIELVVKKKIKEKKVDRYVLISINALIMAYFLSFTARSNTETRLVSVSSTFFLLPICRPVPFFTQTHPTNLLYTRLLSHSYCSYVIHYGLTNIVTYNMLHRTLYI